MKNKNNETDYKNNNEDSFRQSEIKNKKDYYLKEKDNIASGFSYISPKNMRSNSAYEINYLKYSTNKIKEIESYEEESSQNGNDTLTNTFKNNLRII